MMKGWLVYQLHTADYVIGWELGVARVFVEKRAAIRWWRELRQEAFKEGSLYSDDPFEKEYQEARIQDGEKADSEQFDDLLWGHNERNEDMEKIEWEEVEIETGIDAQTIDILKEAQKQYEEVASALAGQDPRTKAVRELHQDRATAISVVLEALGGHVRSE